MLFKGNNLILKKNQNDPRNMENTKKLEEFDRNTDKPIVNLCSKGLAAMFLS